MRHYEIVVMVSAEQFDRATAVAERYQKMIADDGGVIHRFEDWGNRGLAYPIKKRLHARYFLLNVECASDTLGKLRDDFRYSESVIRSLIIRRENAISEASRIMTEERERRAKAAEAEAAEKSDGAEKSDNADGKGGDKDGGKRADKDGGKRAGKDGGKDNAAGKRAGNGKDSGEGAADKEEKSDD